MKKRILSLLLVLLMVVSLVPTMAFADDTSVAVDRINFPDDAFRAYVSENCDTDDNGYLTGKEISRVEAIYAGGRGIASLEGICYFTELQFLSCDNNKLTSLPELPSGLSGLYCLVNQLMELPELPDGLTRLCCSDNQLTELPELPSGLTSLDCSYNQLTKLPELPSSLTSLGCLGNQLTELPELPSGLTWLSCEANQLTEIKLNPSAEYTYINVSDNSLPNKEAVTGQYIDWNEQNFIFGEQKHAHEHVTKLVGATAATCTETGYTGDEVCSICSEVISQGETIPALGHKTALCNAVEPTCTEAGYTGDEVCTVCGEVISQGETIPATGHHFKGNTCPDCGETRSTADTIRAWFQDVKSFFDKIFGKN